MVIDRQLDTGNEADRFGGGSRLADPGERVVIGEGHRGEPEVRGATNQRGRGIRSV